MALVGLRSRDTGGVEAAQESCYEKVRQSLLVVSSNRSNEKRTTTPSRSLIRLKLRWTGLAGRPVLFP